MTTVDKDYFADFRHLANSKLPGHVATLRVLKAAEESIQKRNLPLTADHYYSALWPLLFHPPQPTAAQQQNDPTAEWSAVVTSLVSKVIDDVAIGDGDRYSELYAGITQAPRDENATVARSVCSIAAAVVRQCVLAGSEGAVKESTVEIYRRFLLAIIVDPRPKVRRHAQDTLQQHLAPVLPAALKDELAQFIICCLQESGGRRDCQQAFHVLPFMKRLLPILDFGDQRLQEFVAAAEHCLQLGNNHLTVSVMDVLELTLMAMPVGGDLARRVHGVLVKLQPPSTVAELFVPWLACFAQAVAQVGDRASLVHGLNVVFAAIQCDEAPVLVAGKTAVEQLLSSHAHTHLHDDDLAMIAGSLNQKINVKRFDSFHPATLDICLLTMEAFSQKLCPSFSGTIQMLAILHDRRGFCLQETVEVILQSVCRWIGAEALLDLVPLRLVESGITKNGWLIGVLNKGIFNDRLQVFKTRLLPTAQQLSAKAEQARLAGRDAEAKILDTVATQLLNTIHGFLRYPVDFTTEFDDGFAAQLAAWMTGTPQLRAAICNGIADFIQNMADYGMLAGDDALPIPRGFTNEQADKSGRLFQERFATKFLPCLFNIAITSECEERSYVLRCCEAVLSCVDSGVCADYLDKLLARLPAVSGNADQTTALLDIASSLVKYTNGDIAGLLAVAVEGVTSQDGHIQKRAYRILSIVHQHNPHSLLSDHATVSRVFIDCAVSCDSSARKQRFKLLSQIDIASMQPSMREALVPAVLPELMMGTKEVNNKCRTAAFDVVVRWGRQFMLEGGLGDYLNMVMAGLAAKTPSMMAGAILCLSRLVFEFRAEQCGEQSVNMLLADAITILSSPCKEVVKAAIGFIKVCVMVLGREVLSGKVKDILGGLLVWAQEHHQHFKMRVRHIVERLIRYFGFDAVLAVCPLEHVRLLENIQLVRERRAKRKRNLNNGTRDFAAGAGAGAGERMKPFDEAMFGTDSDDSGDGILAEDDMQLVDDDLTTVMSKKLSLKSLKSLKTLKTAKSAVTSAAATSKSQKQKGNAQNDFKTTRSGKLIIHDSDSDAQVDVDFVQQSRDHSDQEFFDLRRKRRAAADSDDDVPTERDGDGKSVKTRFTSLSHKTALTSKSKVSKFTTKSTITTKSAFTKKPTRDQPRASGKKVATHAYVPLTRRNDKLQSDYFMSRGGKSKTKAHDVKRQRQE